MSFLRSTLIATAIATTGIGAAMAAPVAYATGTTTGTFNVTLSVKAKCTISTTNIADLALGTHDTTDTSISGTTNFDVLCTKKTPFKVGLRPNNVAADTGVGTLKGLASGNTDTIAYQLRQASGTSAAAWGNTLDTNTVTNTGATNTNGSTAINIKVFATVADGALAAVLPDDYKDTVQVTVWY